MPSAEISSLSHVHVFMGPTSAEERPSEPAVREVALQGPILPREKYTTFIGLFPLEDTFNTVTRYTVQFFSTHETTIVPNALRKKIVHLGVPEHIHDASEFFNEPRIQNLSELAAARLNQPSIVIAIGTGEENQESITMFSIHGIRSQDALERISHHMGMEYNPPTARPELIEA